ncbi:MAG TPA: hypothetical protein VGC97_01160 [Pyrinomonadaceae bacterium]|jgi:hypothetical protein
MTEEEKRRKAEGEIGFLPVVDGELVEAAPVVVNLTEDETIVPGRSKIAKADEDETVIPARKRIGKSIEIQIQNPKSKIQNQKIYLLIPFIFLTVALLGGLRLAAADSMFIFWRPALFCLIAAAILMVLFFRARLISTEGWFSEDFSALKNAANGAVLITLFAASVQIFNALLPEQGLPFWIFAFCFFWTLWNNLFADFDTKKLLRSLGALFGLAFVVKYLILANLVAPENAGWREFLQNLTKEGITWLLDLPAFSARTGYIQFFTVALYLLGLFLLPVSSKTKE